MDSNSMLVSPVEVVPGHLAWCWDGLGTFKNPLASATRCHCHLCASLSVQNGSTWLTKASRCFTQAEHKCFTQAPGWGGAWVPGYRICGREMGGLDLSRVTPGARRAPPTPPLQSVSLPAGRPSTLLECARVSCASPRQL
eukprot:3941836-Pleurochrysis_carterae.AAC.1